MEQLFFAGKAYLKINPLVKTPLHEFMAVERSGFWAPDIGRTSGSVFVWFCFENGIIITQRQYSVNNR